MDPSAWSLTYKKKSVADFEALVASYALGDFTSGTCSTLPLLSFVRNAWPKFGTLLEGVRGGTLHFEFKMRPPRGDGEASHTDLMVEAPAAAVAIEAKWTEGM